MDRLSVTAERTTRAAQETLWALVSDVTRYPAWGPWRAAEYRQPGTDSPRGPGAVQWLQSSRRYLLRYPVTIEQIIAVDEGHRLAYTVIDGLPVRNYAAEVTLTPTDDGTLIRWTAAWDATVRGRFVERPLRAVYRQIVDALAAAAERSDTHPDETR